MIYKMMELSTAHITKETCDKMEGVNVEVPVYEKGDYGFFVYVFDKAIKHEVHRRRIPKDLLDCLDYAFSNDCDWIMFDCDAEKISELPTYEW